MFLTRDDERWCVWRGDDVVLHVENYLYCKGTLEVNRAYSRYSETRVSSSQANQEDALLWHQKQGRDVSIPTRVKCGTAMKNEVQSQLPSVLRYVSSASRLELFPLYLERLPLQWSHLTKTVILGYIFTIPLLGQSCNSYPQPL